MQKGGNEMKFLQCKLCKKVTVLLNDTGVPTVCCGENMSELVPGSVDAATEKHVPVVTNDGNKYHVEVGSVLHPMMEEHYIMFIVLETEHGYQMKNLKPGESPVADFVLADGEKAVAVYEYCNLHGLWKTEI